MKSTQKNKLDRLIEGMVKKVLKEETGKNQNLDYFAKILQSYSPSNIEQYDDNVSGFKLRKVNNGITSVHFYMDNSGSSDYPFYINFWGEFDSDEFDSDDWYKNNKFVRQICTLLSSKDPNIAVFLEDEEMEFNSKTVKDFK